MIKNILSIICKDCLIDQRTTLVSYINCFEGITVPILPINLMEFTIATLWRKNADENTKVRLRYKSPDGVIKDVGQEFSFEPPNNTEHRIQFLVGGLLAEKEGVYSFLIEYKEGDNWKIAQELFLTVKKLTNLPEALGVKK